MSIEIIQTDNAPEALGPYSQARKVGQFIFCSGQVPLDPKTMKLVEGGIVEQTRRVCENIRAVLQAAGADFDRVVKTTCFMKDLSQFAEFNKTYGEYFGDQPPARSTYEVSKLPLDALIEIEVIAVL